jgi:hypothetical protein
MKEEKYVCPASTYPKSDLSDELESITKKKGEFIADSPFVHDSRLVNLELISPVQIAVEPAPTSPDSGIITDPEVFLYGRGQV